MVAVGLFAIVTAVDIKHFEKTAIMRYEHNKKTNKIVSWSPLQPRAILPIGLLVCGLYIGILTVSPTIVRNGSFGSPQENIIKNVDQPTASQTNQVIIPKIGVQVPFYSGNETVLEKGAWHRYPDRGNPESGGNFILSAHRFNLGWTPRQTRAKSPFYNLHKLREGDAIIVVYNGMQYDYRIVNKFTVKPSEITIENTSDTPKLTLYSCTLKGANDGRDVLEAQLSSAVQVTTIVKSIQY